MIPVPVPDENDSILEIILDDITYFLHFSWNDEAKFWVLGIEDANQQTILQGVVLVPNRALLTQFRIYAVPPGEFVAYADDDNIIIDRDSFNNGSVVLYYMTEAEYAAL